MRTLCLSLLTLLVTGSAHAQDEERTSTGKDEVVREIVRGFYLKSNLGSTIYMGTHGVRRPGTGAPLLSGVMNLQIGVGGDFIDRERFSAAWEVDFQQGLFNGPRTEDLASLPPLLEGDIHTFAGLAGVEVSTYVTRRLGLGVRAGGGVMLIPLLMHPTEYDAAIVNGNWQGTPAALHEGPLPMVFGGPTLEYYTKLSHFSVGAELDVSYVIGFDLGFTPSGYLKYTF